MAPKGAGDPREDGCGGHGADAGQGQGSRPPASPRTSLGKPAVTRRSPKTAWQKGGLVMFDSYFDTHWPIRKQTKEGPLPPSHLGKVGQGRLSNPSKPNLGSLGGEPC